MGMGMIGIQGVGVGTIIPQSNPLGDLMLVQGRGNNISVSHVRRQRRRPEGDMLQGELRKIKPPTFNDENRKGEKGESWLLEMKKYF
jgi:hypothetical protein